MFSHNKLLLSQRKTRAAGTPPLTLRRPKARRYVYTETDELQIK